MEFHCARTTRAGEHAPLGNEEMRNVTTRPECGVEWLRRAEDGERIEGVMVVVTTVVRRI
jgi:hypothetical protein